MASFEFQKTEDKKRFKKINKMQNLGENLILMKIWKWINSK